jgi:nucleotide-binding universal stress UspA family protein
MTIASDDTEVDPTASRTARVVVGVDGSASSRLALARAAELAQQSDAVLEPVMAWQYPMMANALVLENWSPEQDAATRLRDCVRDAFPEGVPSWVRPTVVAGPAAHALIEASTGADLVVVGSRGHGGFAGLMLGSVSSACAEYAHCPVLVMREPTPTASR